MLSQIGFKALRPFAGLTLWFFCANAAAGPCMNNVCLGEAPIPAAFTATITASVTPAGFMKLRQTLPSDCALAVRYSAVAHKAKSVIWSEVEVKVDPDFLPVDARTGYAKIRLSLADTDGAVRCFAEIQDRQRTDLAFANLEISN